MEWGPWLYAAVAAAFLVTYFTYGVEKQVRRCKPREKASAMLNLAVDLFFFVAEGTSFDLSILKSPELGSAQPDPVAKGSSQYTMKQLVSGGTAVVTTLSSSHSKSSLSKTPSSRVTVAV
jgi:hypothetical protein